MIDRHEAHKALLSPLFAAQYDWDRDAIRAALDRLAATDAVFHLAHPFGDMAGPAAFHDQALAPLQAAWPDVERRDWIVMAGEDEHGADWVGCAGHFMGTFASPFLDIPPTGHLAHMRFHEFYRIADGKIVEYQALWDISEVMMQAHAWPMAPSLGREFCVPGPASGDGLRRAPRDPDQSRTSRQLIIEMLDHMTRHPAQGGPEVMEMPRFWSERMNWYGPAGIGTGRGIEGFRHWHQVPFLRAMPDRGQDTDAITCHFFGDNNYAAVTGWPNMVQTITHDGWLGIAPAGRKVTIKSLDFWRIENGLIRENWVMVDILDVLSQLGVDVFARLREFNKARVPGSVPYPIGGKGS
ncbi:ester cyclase [Ponticoccus sp. SC2-23]|uniref:ester cyclase n=1 Tax=Alexandriicola marinus TaxID=2081710 RepID=UPI000FDBBB72|nr:ester cyclase [Alexandriicola marinus]MBM1221088.1 ester cyclase [Ponticoccus sp. SC6-9]MBM1225658.1 ester cyclase [Ponticoccus sp. SC6-15]MBM1227810.1 ester cyclase [Ponticoccus sp. SC6-38]MBM1234552.1 ester cyclase [Ponticoccus sp. SC6-45]MBM1238312.1 ester cyclase [Ponticoccus sp. SC6-49]MBM1243581.1 ester cyclase [Ponticoccus sp. SC2-64]MBM1248076.1 ester cyclase [Ponticoccus sp. SC6-42]MBM1252712.1 ester cyclase [Ponticoccus sp. SC6-33]MBM1256321.1 ester cyclase [Ponticoccus sp. SC